MTRKQIAAADAPKAIGPYAQAVLQDGWLWCSGQIPVDPATGNLVTDARDEAGVRAQTARVLANLRAVLSAAGAAPRDVVKCTVYMTDLAHFAAMNEEYAKCFGTERPPARATVEVSRLPKGAAVEIDCVARVDGRSD